MTCDTLLVLQVQEVLCRPGHVERFFPTSPAAAAAIRRCFAQIISLEAISPALRASVVAAPDAWVLKPQREGGASNLFGADIAHAFTTWDDATLQQYAAVLPALYICNILRRYILMERLQSPSFPTVMLRGGQATQVQVLLLLLLLLLLLANLTPRAGRVRKRHLRLPAA